MRSNCAPWPSHGTTRKQWVTMTAIAPSPRNASSREIRSVGLVLGMAVDPTERGYQQPSVSSAGPAGWARSPQAPRRWRDAARQRHRSRVHLIAEMYHKLSELYHKRRLSPRIREVSLPSESIHEVGARGMPGADFLHGPLGTCDPVGGWTTAHRWHTRWRSGTRAALRSSSRGTIERRGDHDAYVASRCLHYEVTSALRRASPAEPRPHSCSTSRYVQVTPHDLESSAATFDQPSERPAPVHLGAG